MNRDVPRNTAPAIHGLLLLAALVIVTAGFPALPWPWHLALPLLVYGAIVLAVDPLRRTAPRLAVGRLGGIPFLFAIAVAIGAPAILLTFQALIDPDVTELAAKLPAGFFGNLILTGILFSVVNAVLEELIFRGVFWEVIAAEWNSAIALVVTAALFGVGHLDGYPPGPLGAVLAGLYGFTLGALRWWTGGLGLATGCHVCADAAIFCILVE